MVAKFGIKTCESPSRFWQAYTLHIALHDAICVDCYSRDRCRSIKHMLIYEGSSKPGNILFQNQTRAQENRDSPARFLWADFGLAYDFSDSGDSKTRSTKIYSPRYAPPEVVANARRSKSKERRYSTLASVNEVLEDGEVNLKARFNMNHLTSDEVEAHGRAADIFALGCVYLELLSRLVKSDLPLEVHPQEKVMFADNIDRLSQWADENKDVEEDKELRPLFGVATRMISRDADRRLQIDEVVKSVMKAGNSFSCTMCRHDYETEIKSTRTSLPSPAASPVASPGVGASTSPRHSISRPFMTRASSAKSSGMRSPRNSRSRMSTSN